MKIRQGGKPLHSAVNGGRQGETDETGGERNLRAERSVVCHNGGRNTEIREMTETLFVLLLGIPAGLLAGALLLEAFVLRENAREQEPAVLWLMFCAVVAAGVVVLVEAGLYMWRGDGARLGEAMWVGGAGVAGALAWWFKRKGRDRGVLYLRERFYGENPLEPPVAKPGQAFWILGWRGLAVVALAASLAAVLRERVGMNLLAGRGGEAEVKDEETVDPAEAALVANVKPADVYVPGAEGGARIVPVEPVAGEAGGDPTRAELPTAEESEKAAAMAVNVARVNRPMVGISVANAVPVERDAQLPPSKSGADRRRSGVPSAEAPLGARPAALLAGTTPPLSAKSRVRFRVSAANSTESAAFWPPSAAIDQMFSIPPRLDTK